MGAMFPRSARVLSSIPYLVFCAIASVALGPGCVDLTPPWEGSAANRDATRDAAGNGSGGNQPVLVDASGMGGEPTAGTVETGGGGVFVGSVGAGGGSGASGGAADVLGPGSGGAIDTSGTGGRGNDASGAGTGPEAGASSGTIDVPLPGSGGVMATSADGATGQDESGTGGAGGRSAAGDDAPLAAGGAPGTGGEAGCDGAGSGGGWTGGTGSGGTSSGSGGAGRAGSGGTSSGSGGSGGTGTVNPGDIVINPSTTFQTMDGFGAADVWASNPLNTAQVTLFFDPVNGIGLSLLHIGMDPDGQPMYSSAVADAQAASEFGVKVWASAWSPPANTKGNSNVNCTDSNTTHLLTSGYDSWASALAGFPATFKNLSGVQLYAISVQSEPDSCSNSHASCLYSAAEMVNFIGVLGPKLAALSPPVKLLAAESAQWSNLWSGSNYGNAILNDSAASAAVAIVATHDRSASGLTRPSPPATNTHPIWQTEAYDESGTTSPDIGHGISIAQSIWAAVTSGGASAWHYWWLVTLGNDAEGLLLQNGDTSNPPKRLYTVGNFSKFVRPGYLRIGVSDSVPSGVQMAAFFNPADSTVVIVAINSNTSAQSVSLSISGTTAPSQVTPWVTSASDNLASQTAIPLSGARFSTTLAAQTVTSFVGKP